MKIHKMSVGIDVDSAFYVCVFSLLVEEGLSTKVVSRKRFDATVAGRKALIKWIERCLKSSADAPQGEVPLEIIMEPTGVYHEELAYELSEQGYRLVLVSPYRARRFAQSLGRETKTDPVSADSLAQMSLRNSLRPWQPPSKELLKLKQLVRERRQLKKDKTRLSNRLKAHKRRYDPSEGTTRRFEAQLVFFNQQLREVEKAIRVQVRADKQFWERVKRITQVKGLGLLTVVTLLAETHGFATFSSRKQLTSYAGLDVRINQSGKFQGKTRISKRGNEAIRTALYMPAITAARHNPYFKKYYQRLLKRNKHKKQALIATARKLLLLVYALFQSWRGI